MIQNQIYTPNYRKKQNSLKDIFKKHKNKIITGAGVITLMGLTNQYLPSNFKINIDLNNEPITIEDKKSKKSWITCNIDKNTYPNPREYGFDGSNGNTKDLFYTLARELGCEGKTCYIPSVNDDC